MCSLYYISEFLIFSYISNIGKNNATHKVESDTYGEKYSQEWIFADDLYPWTPCYVDIYFWERKENLFLAGILFVSTIKIHFDENII